MAFDKDKIASVIMPVLGLGLTLLSGWVNSKNQDAKMEAAVEKKVAEALANLTKES